MKKERLFRQYTQLLETWGQEVVYVSISNVAELLTITPRYARMIVNEMSREGWLTWKGKPGRGSKGVLQCKINKLDLGIQRDKSPREQSNSDKKNSLEKSTQDNNMNMKQDLFNVNIEILRLQTELRRTQEKINTLVKLQNSLPFYLD